MSGLAFALYTVRPQGFVFANAFNELEQSLCHGLRDLGVPADIVETPPDDGRVCLLLGPNLLPDWPVPLPERTILYNLEQLWLDSPWLSERLFSLYRRFPLWDYSAQNLRTLQRMGIAGTTYVPIGFHERWVRITPGREDLEVVLIGMPSGRRAAIVDGLRARGVDVHYVTGVYGAERDRLLARAKIVLNVHVFDHHVFEQVRVMDLLSNERFVVSEASSACPEEDAFARGLAIAPYDAIVDTCVRYLETPGERQRIARAGAALARKRPITAFLEDALNKTFGRPAAPPRISARPLRARPSSDLGVVFTHYRTDPVTERNLASFRAHHAGPVETASAEARFPDTADCATERWQRVTAGERERRWRNADLLVFEWFKQRRHRCRTWLIVDWDTLCTGPLDAYARAAQDYDVVAPSVKLTTRDLEWPWFREVPRLPPELQPYAMGVVPFCGTIVSETALSAMCDALDRLASDIFCELRFATLAAWCGFPPVANPEADAGLSWTGAALGVRAPGVLRHPVKE